MAETNPYAGKIKHQGPQEVKGPYAETGDKGKVVVHTGSDLRAGKG